MIKQINATVLFVRNFDACVEFYRDALGFKVKDTDEGFTSFDFGEYEFARFNEELLATQGQPGPHPDAQISAVHPGSRRLVAPSPPGVPRR